MFLDFKNYLTEAKIHTYINPQQLTFLRTVCGDSVDYEELPKTDKIPDVFVPLSASQKENFIQDFLNLTGPELKQLAQLESYVLTPQFISLWDSLNGDIISLKNSKKIKNVSDLLLDSLSNVYYDQINTFDVTQEQPGVKKNKKIKLLAFINKYTELINYCDQAKPSEHYRLNYCDPKWPYPAIETNKRLLEIINKIKSQNYCDATYINKLMNYKLIFIISGNPARFVNMSLSPFYPSCVNIYGGKPKRVTTCGSLFDVNSKVAQIMIEYPYRDKKGIKHAYTVVMRSIVRYLEEENIIYQDLVYPNTKISVSGVFDQLIQDSCFLPITKAKPIKKTSSKKKDGEEKITDQKPQKRYTTQGYLGVSAPHMDTLNLNIKRIIPDLRSKIRLLQEKDGIKYYVYRDHLNLSHNNINNWSEFWQANGLAENEKIIQIKGNLDISFNNFTNFQDGPLAINGHLIANNNQLINLLGFPKVLKGDCLLHVNQIISLEGCNAKLERGIKLSNNKLKNLKFGPRYVTGSCLLDNNDLANLEYGPKVVGKVFNISNNKIRSFQYSPEIIGNGYIASNNLIQDWQGLENTEIRGDLVVIEAGPVIKLEPPSDLNLSGQIRYE